MGADDLDLLRAAGTESTIAAGQTLIERGHPGTGLFVVVEGTVVVEAPEGTRELGPGAVIGERALLSGTRTEVFAFTESTPASVARATRSARAPSRVQIEPDSPYGVSFERRIASASSSNGITAATGPNTSARATRSSFVASTRVQGYQNPGPSGIAPRNAGSPSTNDATVSRCAAETSGPISVASSSGSPTFTPRVEATRRSRKRS